ncbi:MAG TPA: hypothetical protein VJ975_10955, partial [Candidatus Limnocylindria bacterium]|nr:hypothetical protein [Candidatus Limnocylindria bacterium]
WARVRSAHHGASGEIHYAFEFEPEQFTSRAMVTRAIFDGNYPVAGTERRAWADVLRTELSSLSERFARVPRPASERPLPADAPRPERPPIGRPTTSGAAG